MHAHVRKNTHTHKHPITAKPWLWGHISEQPQRDSSQDQFQPAPPPPSQNSAHLSCINCKQHSKSDLCTDTQMVPAEITHRRSHSYTGKDSASKDNTQTLTLIHRKEKEVWDRHKKLWLTEGLLGSPTLWPKQVRRLTSRSLVRACKASQDNQF